MSEPLRNRIAALQSRMAEQNVDLALFGPSANMFYVSGLRLPQTERFNAIAVPARGRPAVMLPTLQAPLVPGPLRTIFDVHVWAESDDPLALVAQAADPTRRIAVDGRMWSGFLLGLQARIPGATWLDAGELTDSLRVRKGTDELEQLRDLGIRFDKIWAEFLSGRIIGRTENDVRRQLGELVLAHGFPDGLAWCDVGSGPNGASPLHHGSERVIESGDPVVIDFAAARNGYYMDTCRTPVAGEPAPDFVAIYDTVNRAYEAAEAAICPGVTAQSIDRAGRDLIAAAGHGEHFLHRIGHGLGLDAHEQPYLVAGNAEPLATGMVFSVEPGIYLAERWGVRIENIIAVTETGPEPLGRTTLELVSMS